VHPTISPQFLPVYNYACSMLPMCLLEYVGVGQVHLVLSNLLPEVAAPGGSASCWPFARRPVEFRLAKRQCTKEAASPKNMAHTHLAYSSLIPPTPTAIWATYAISAHGPLCFIEKSFYLRFSDMANWAPSTQLHSNPLLTQGKRQLDRSASHKTVLSKWNFTQCPQKLKHFVC